MIQLSIIVPVYNTEKYLSRCLDSLIRQDLSPNEYEIIVINDGSQDNSREIVRDYMSRHPQISFFEQANQGLFETRNVGIDRAKGKYIYFVDSDDFIAPNVMGKIIRFMDQKGLDLFGFGIIETAESSIPTPRIEESLKEAAIHEGPAYISNQDFRKESVWLVIDMDFLKEKKITHRPGIGFSDGLFTTELFYHAKRVAVIPDDIYAYFQHADSILHNPSPDHYRKLLKRYEATTDDFREFRSEIGQSTRLSPSGMERIRSKEVSYIFFMLIRAVKSNLSLKEIHQMLQRLRSKDYYPIRGFIGSDYTNYKYRLLLFVLNNEILFYPAIVAYRVLAPVLRKLR